MSLISKVPRRRMQKTTIFGDDLKEGTLHRTQSKANLTTLGYQSTPSKLMASQRHPADDPAPREQQNQPRARAARLTADIPQRNLLNMARMGEDGVRRSCPLVKDHQRRMASTSLALAHSWSFGCDESCVHERGTISHVWLWNSLDGKPKEGRNDKDLHH